MNSGLSGKRLLLVGGGHSQVEVLRQFGMSPPANGQLTLITNAYHAPYSGMLPGFIAGHYGYHDIHIDVRPLAKFAGCRVFQDSVVGVDLERKEVHCGERPPVPFDLLSFNIGSTPAMDDVPGAREFAVPAKPVDAFLEEWERIKVRAFTAGSEFRVLIVGGGVGGVELALSVHHMLSALVDEPGRLSFQVVASTPEILMTHNAGVRRHAAQHLRRNGIGLATGESISRVTEAEVECANGTRFGFDALLWVTNASPAPWIAASGIETDDQGFILVDETLRSTSHAFVFAAGDIATMARTPRPKSGVFAVRQGPYLAKNLRHMLAGDALEHFTPQRRFLSLISTGDKNSIASKGWWATEGALIWKWKDRIDRKFMKKYANLPGMGEGVEMDAEDSSTHAMHCAGCGSKVGSTVLNRALQRLRGSQGDGVCVGLDAPDDAAVVEVPAGKLAVHSVDFFRSFLDDPYVFGAVTVNHCLSDLHAMGATPHTALALVTLPYGEAKQQESLLHDLLAGALKALDAEGATLVGGHTTEGPELSFGLSVNGYIDRNAIQRKAGMGVGEKLILTKALGTGVILAADMRGKARGQWVEGATKMMLMSNGKAAACLQEHGATACTDVTGFGLAGHLIEMCKASQVAVTLSLDSVPLLAGAMDLTAMGIRSSLYPQNARRETDFVVESGDAEHAAYPLLFDPQTAGGLLASVPADRAAGCLEALRHGGYQKAVVIGEAGTLHAAGKYVSLV